MVLQCLDPIGQKSQPMNFSALPQKFELMFFFSSLVNIYIKKKKKIFFF